MESEKDKLEKERRVLREKRIVLQHQEDRMNAVLKQHERKARNHRLIVWGAELEYRIARELPEYADGLQDFTEEKQKAVVDRLFSSSGIVAEIGAALQSQIDQESPTE